MVEKSEQIRDRIDAQRDELGANLNELERRFRTTTDWRAHVERRPWAAVGLAFGTGIALAAFTNRSDSIRSAYSGYSDSWSENYEPSSARKAKTSSETRMPAFRNQASRFSSTLDNVFASLLAVASTRMHDILSEAVPGFKDQYERTVGERGGRAEQTYGGSGQSQWAEPTSYGNTGSSNIGNEIEQPRGTF